jgi:glycosyltransferase involved in cell wall biosynthesis
LALGAGLHAVYLLPGISAFLAIWWLRKNRLKFAKKVVAIKSNLSVQWRIDIFPLQWRIAVSWLSGYLIFNAFTPIIFAHQGAAEAGKIGIALSIFTSLSNLVMSWSNAVTPEMIGLISRGELKQLRVLFFRVLRSSLAFSVFSCTAVVFGVILLPTVGLTAASARIADVPTLGCLAVANITNSVIFAAAIYMRAHKQEPMLWPSFVMGMLNIAALYFSSKVNSFLPVALFASITLFVGLPWTLFLLRPYVDRSKNSKKGEGIHAVKLTSRVQSAASLTIYVACYNRPDYANDAIRSALAQTDKNFFLLISDNSTTSHVGDMVREYFPNTAYIRRNPQLKASEHFNQILSECESDYVMVMHDDDLLAPQFVEQMQQLISNLPGRKCYACNASVINSAGEQTRKHFYLSFGAHQLLRSPLQLTKRWFAYATLSVAPFPSYIYNRRDIDNIRFDAKRFGQFIDYGFIHECLLNDGAIAWLNRPLYLYRSHESQDSADIKFTSYTKIKNYIKRQHVEYYRTNAFGLARASMLTSFPQLKRHTLLHRKVQRVKVWKLISSPSAIMRKLTLSVDSHFA